MGTRMELGVGEPWTDPTKVRGMPWVGMGIPRGAQRRDALGKGNRLKADCVGEAAPCSAAREWLQKWHLIIQH